MIKNNPYLFLSKKNQRDIHVIVDIDKNGYPTARIENPKKSKKRFYKISVTINNTK